jgi:hypothetical protein
VVGAGFAVLGTAATDVAGAEGDMTDFACGICDEVDWPTASCAIKASVNNRRAVLIRLQICMILFLSIPLAMSLLQ